jgi:hypothetical protein
VTIADPVLEKDRMALVLLLLMHLSMSVVMLLLRLQSGRSL